MLKRISKLKSIGRFRNTSCAGVHFPKIAIIFGRNTYGKTTLGDLLSSIQSNDLTDIITRKSIPRDDDPQEAAISFLIPSESTETAITLESGQWQPNLPQSLKLLVFDDGFHSKNIFAARKFTRSTKENFSAFVIGEQGVAKARTIAEKNRKKRAATQARNRLSADAFSQIQDIPAFIVLVPDISLDEAKSQVGEMRRQIDSLTEQRTNSELIRNRNLSQKLTWDFNFTDTLTSFNELLSSTLESHHQEARARVTKHIETHFKNDESAESWIRSGLAQNNGKTCQFCSQKLSNEAIDLLDLYRQSFDTSFEEHDKTIRANMASLQNEFLLERISSMRLIIESNNSTVLSYPEILNEDALNTLNQEMQGIANEINNEFQNWNHNVSEFLLRLENSIALKRATPHKAIEAIYDENLSETSKNLVNLVEKYNVKVTDINEVLESFKDSVDPGDLTERINELKERIKTISLMQKRLELTSQVERYTAYETEIEELNEEIPRLDEELRTEQSTYLDEFFVNLNKWFAEFGSHDFTLERGEDNSGHTPIYFLRVRYCGQIISERELECLFSESDRRALALAVFWSSISNLSEDEIRKTIIVLDDPVTSFDNNRITAVHQEIARISDTARQVIILSHYDVEVSKFLATYKNSKEVGLIEIVRSQTGSNLETADIDNFIMDEHSRKTTAILKFINGETNSHNTGDLRIFFEKEINLRFARQLLDLTLSGVSLGDKIRGLKEAGIITEALATEADDWRNNLNPNHHAWTSSDVEDQRRTSSRFMDFVYSRLRSA